MFLALKMFNDIFRSFVQVPLGVLLHNENKLDNLAKILSHYMKLVPTAEAEGHRQLPNGSIINFDVTQFFSILFGGASTP